MRFFERLKAKLTAYYSFTSEKSASTYAGGLAYFYFAGLVPFIALALSLFDALAIDGSSLDVILGSNLSFFWDYAIEESANVGSDLLMAALAFYSSAHFYFHLIRTGERIYDSKRSKGVVKRVLSFVYLITVQTLTIAVVWLRITGEALLTFIGCSARVVVFLRFSVGVAFNLLLSLAFHLFAVPVGKKSIKYAGRGIVFTFVYRGIADVVFDLYSSLSRTNELSIAAVATFLLYLYWTMRGLIGGMAVNALFLNKTEGVSAKPFKPEKA